MDHLIDWCVGLKYCNRRRSFDFLKEDNEYIADIPFVKGNVSILSISYFPVKVLIPACKSITYMQFHLHKSNEQDFCLI